jgi:uncharacterized membrane protein (UPF0127 family)
MALLRNTTTDTIVATRIDRLSGVLQRTIGLLARPRVQCDEGVWIASCSAIHTVGMRCAIDVLFVDRDGCVVHIYRGLKPNRVAFGGRDARGVVELGSGALDQIDVMIGDRLELVAS